MGKTIKKAQAGTKTATKTGKTKDMFNTNPAQLRAMTPKTAKLLTMPSQGVKNRAALMKKSIKK